MQRKTFLGHFVITLAAAGAAALAATAGVPQAIFASDASYMTSAIAALLVVTTSWLGLQAWRTDSAWDWAIGRFDARHAVFPDTAFGHLAERLAVMFGMLGTVIGFGMQLKAAHGSVDSLVAFSTQFSSTGCGIVAASIIALMTFNVEAAVRKARS